MSIEPNFYFLTLFLEHPIYIYILLEHYPTHTTFTASTLVTLFVEKNVENFNKYVVLEKKNKVCERK
jgi:hypothetical protein